MGGRARLGGNREGEEDELVRGVIYALMYLASAAKVEVTLLVGGAGSPQDVLDFYAIVVMWPLDATRIHVVEVAGGKFCCENPDFFAVSRWHEGIIAGMLLRC